MKILLKTKDGIKEITLEELKKLKALHDGPAVTETVTVTCRGKNGKVKWTEEQKINNKEL